MRKTFVARLLLSASGVAAVAGLASPALAQAAPAGAESTDIIVTAQRRAERIEDVPASITAITPETLARTGLTRYQDLGELSPGVSISRNGAYTQPAIRGITTQAVGSGNENNVATYIDGFYQTNPLVANADIANVEGVQILKGPQGTLYGRNAMGGAILMTTLTPSDTLTGKAMVGYGNLDEKRMSAYLSGPLGQGVKFSIAGYSRSNHGYIRDVGTKATPSLDDGFWSSPFDSQSLRAKLQFDLSSNLTAILGYNYTFVSDPRGSTWVERSQLPIRGVSIPANATTYFDPTTDTSEIDKSSTNFGSIFKIKQHQGTMTLKLKTGIGTLSSYTSYDSDDLPQKYDFDGTKRDYSTTIARNKERTFQQAIDYNIDAIDHLNLTVGGLYYYDKYTVDSDRVSNFTVLSNTRIVSKSTAASGYVDATFDVSDKLFITAGGRYSWEGKSFYHNNSAAPAATTLTPITKNYSAFTPRFNIRYNLADRTNIYASVSKGFKSGMFNQTSFTSLATIIPADQETVWAYEAGFKTVTDLFRFEASAWYYDYKGLQTTVTTTINVGGSLQPSTLLQNAKSAESYGAEASFAIKPAEGLNLAVGAAYIHARYKDFANASGAGLTADGSLNVTATQDLSGLPMLRAPTWSGNASADYTFAAFGGKMVAASSLYFTTDYIPNNPSTGQSPATTTVKGVANTNLAGRPDDRTQRFIANGYATVNASLAWTDPADHVTVTGWVRNLTNKRYLITWSAQAFGTYSQYSEPRTYGVKLEYKF
ncbi:TonB-dependent receptor [Novosphingobium bradum]|uniref:TonB-dependent receptor n=1 Tax=Novosphingobium bradum TaxID=1737444 RepID=A0ABV7IRI4_9SPHN